MQDFKSIKLSIASPEEILNWSYGEVKNAETINYRSLRPEQDGLMCERIFGPVKDYECYCGKYKKIKYKGIVCDKCGVEVTHSRVRRNRMGHIKLATPVVHIWYSYGVPNKLSIILDIPTKKLVSVIYYVRYIVTEVDEQKRKDALIRLDEIKQKEYDKIDKDTEQKISELGSGAKSEKEKAKLLKAAQDKKLEIDADIKNISIFIKELSYKDVISEENFRKINELGLKFFVAEMGAEAIKKLLRDLDLEAIRDELQNEYNLSKGEAKTKVERRLKYILGFIKNKTKPEYLVLDVLPVLPPELRPIVALAGGRFAVSDVNDLYRRIINRNNRLKDLVEIGAPEIILRNERRMLQEAVDALIDNEHRYNTPIKNRMGQPYKSLTEELRGKQGRFRRNLLGKRVDYSGRAVIIPDTNIGLDQCGIPASIALELYKPFVINNLIKKEIVSTIREANDLIEAEDPRVWDIVEEVIKDKVVLLNRAPTLHKYNIQAYYPIIVEGEAIRINQLIAGGFNADFDGDAMTIHAVLGNKALKEAKAKMLSRRNLLKVADGSPIVGFGRDMILGLYSLTLFEGDLEKVDTKKYFYSIDETVKAYDLGLVRENDVIILLTPNGTVKTTVGRVIFNKYLPAGYRFVNETVSKKVANAILRDIILTRSPDESVSFLDNVKKLSFKYATKLGFSISTDDLTPFAKKSEYIEEGKRREVEIQTQYNQGFITNEEKGRLIIETWDRIKNELVDKVWDSLDIRNPLKFQVLSGANGDKSQAGQILAMQGIVIDPMGNKVRFPILGNYSDGLNAYEYFVSARGGRKGMVDTALKTSQSGYLTRKLVDVAQDVIIREHDCGYEGEGIVISRSDVRTESFRDRILGRYVAEDVVIDGKVLVPKNEVITVKLAEQIDLSNLDFVRVRTPLLCKSPYGLCVKCYGYDFGTYKPVKIGKAVGVIAAESLGEPTTQLTLRTFHGGGVGADITSGFPRVEELFEARAPKVEGLIANFDGVVHLAGDKIVITGEKKQKNDYVLHSHYKVAVENGARVERGDKLFEVREGEYVGSLIDGTVSLSGNILSVIGTVPVEESRNIPQKLVVMVKEGDHVLAGQPLTNGAVNPKDLARTIGFLGAQRYIVDEVQKVFRDFSIGMKDIHIEVIARQMAKLAKIVDVGDTDLIPGTYINKYEADYLNAKLLKDDKKPITYVTDLLGVTSVSLNAESILAAMSFQEQVKVISDAAIIGREDKLRGLKENVIIGRLIPVGKRAIIKD